MAQISILDHSEKYEWEGTFWFPENEEKRFSGKVTYTPDKGIRFELFSVSDFADLKRDVLSKKRLFAIVNSQNPTPVTLINVHLSAGFSLGQFSIRTLSGSAVMMVVGELLEKTEIDKLEIKYDDRLENIFFWQKDRDAFKFGDTALTVTGDYKVSVSIRGSGMFITSPDDIDAIFWSNDKEKLLPIKTAIEDAIKDKAFFLSRRSNTFPTFLFSKDGSSSEDFLHIERKWRYFWELILDHAVNVENVWFYFKNEESSKYYSRPILVSFFRPETPYGYICHMGQLPISFFSFGSKGNDFSVIQPSFNKWLEINNNPQWRPVLEGIRRILESRKEIADTAKYISLISEIETFLDLIGATKTNADGLIENYASKEWKDSFSNITGKLSADETLGKWAHDVRNAIAHPKSMAKISNGKYVQILEDYIRVHKAYAHLSALLLKGIFSYLGGINPEHVEAHIKRFMQERVSVSIARFED